MESAELRFPTLFSFNSPGSTYYSGEEKKAKKEDKAKEGICKGSR